MDAFYGFQDLATQTQSGADAERASGHTPPQIGQVTTLSDHIQDPLNQSPEQHFNKYDIRKKNTSRLCFIFALAPNTQRYIYTKREKYT